VTSIQMAINSGCGWRFLSLEERFAAFRKAGFQSVLLWWGEGEKESRKERVALAKSSGLEIVDVHAEMSQSNSIWLSGAQGEQKICEYIATVEECAKCGIERMVIHLTNGDTPPDISTIGLKRIERLMASAVRNDVILAIENVRVDAHIKFILDYYKEKHVALCYDAGHANLWCKDTDWLSLYKDRIAAVHLHDNNGEEDEHNIPFRGTVDWKNVMPKMKASSYNGCLPLETDCRGIDDGEQFEDFLNAIYESGLKLSIL